MTVGIVGLGLIGTSVGLAFRRADPNLFVLGLDLNPGNAEIAHRRGAVHLVASDLEALGAAELVVVSATPNASIEILSRLEQVRSPETLATDCASIKGPMCDWRDAVPSRSQWFVPGHPMAGKAEAGPGAADASLFEGAVWALCGDERCRTGVGREIEALIRVTGARPVWTDGESHDRAVALRSHVLHMLAGALVEMAASDGLPPLCGPAWRDFTRIAGSHPGLWTEIVLGNREAIAATLAELEDRTRELRRLVAVGTPGEILDAFESARRAKDRCGSQPS
ncbi:MAG: prephenate dehydrogenase/arogenate dehydrogenase family protein [Fimbriimonadaceae bacterium]